MDYFDVMPEVMKMAESLNKYDNEIFQGMGNAALCMLIEERAKRENTPLLDFYKTLTDVARAVVEDMGDVV